ncbi:hypothetical protein D3C75_272030 [compost metagenome]
MMCIIIFLAVVIPGYLDDVCTFLCILPRHIVRADRYRTVAARVMQQHLILLHPGNLLAPLAGMGIIDFVADAPHDQARTVPVAPDPAGNIPSPPFREKTGVVVRRLAALPHVKRFRNDQHAQLIGQLHQLNCRHVMGGADGIHAHLLQQHNLPAQRCHINCCPQRPKIMVLAHPVQLKRAAVEEKSLVTVKLHCPEAEPLAFHLDSSPAGQQLCL